MKVLGRQEIDRKGQKIHIGNFCFLPMVRIEITCVLKARLWKGILLLHIL